MGNSSTLVMYCVTVSSPSARRVGMTCSIVMEGAPISGVGCHRNQPIEDVPKSCRTCRNARSGRPPLLARMPIAPLGTPQVHDELSRRWTMHFICQVATNRSSATRGFNTDWNEFVAPYTL
jgi:hypothetical protein